MNKFLFNLRRRCLHIADRLMSLGKRDESLDDFCGPVGVDSPGMIDLLIISYKYGAFYVEEGVMRSIIINKSRLDNFEKVKALRELYLIDLNSNL